MTYGAFIAKYKMPDNAESFVIWMFAAFSIMNNHCRIL